MNPLDRPFPFDRSYAPMGPRVPRGPLAWSLGSLHAEMALDRDCKPW